MPSPLSLFRALADPTRLRIVQLLREGELAIGEVAQVLGQSQPRVSRHVRILAEAGLVDRRREGSWTFLASGLASGKADLGAAVNFLLDGDDDRDRQEDVARLALVRAERGRIAESWFAAHAGAWDALRRLHADDAAVEAAIMKALDKRPLGRLLDIGTGTGRMLELLAPLATDALGIDRSPDMLRLARSKLAHGSHAVRLMQADAGAVPVEDASIDTLIIHQVLHYLPSPDQVLAEVGRILAKQGCVLIVDFESHNVEELRSRDAHARLGFSDAQIGGWFAANGMRLDHVEALAGDPLTVKLWRGVKA